MDECVTANYLQSNNTLQKLLSQLLRWRTEYVLILIQFIITAPGLGWRPLWLDEAYSAILARKSFSQIHQTLKYDAGPPYYYDLLHCWRFIFGESEIALRLLSLLFAFAVTVLIYHLCKRIFDWKTAVFSCLIWILSPLAISYSHEARNYTLLAALAIAYAFCITFFITRHSLLGILFSLPVLVVALYTHNIAWFFLPAGFIATLFFTRNRWVLTFLLISYGAAIFLYIPWFPTLLQQMKNTELTIGWVAKAWSPYILFSTLRVFTPGGETPPYIDLISFPAIVRFLNGIFIFLILVLALYRWTKEKQREMTFLFLFFFVGLLGIYFYSWFGNPIYLAGRTDFFLFPFWCIGLGYGLCFIQNDHIRFSLISLLVFEMLILTIFNYAKEDRLSEEDLIRYLKRHADKGDVILCTGLTRPVFEYYLESDKLKFMSYPMNMSKHLAHLNERWYIENLNLKKEANDTVQKVFKHLPKDNQLWVIGSNRRINQPLFKQLEQTGHLRKAAHIQTQETGLRKLGEPIFSERYNYVEKP